MGLTHGTVRMRSLSGRPVTKTLKRLPAKPLK
jgi:hypothetical protein